MVGTIVSRNSLKRYTFNEALNTMWELILNKNEEVQNSAENSFASYSFNPTDQMPLEITSNTLLRNKWFKNMSVVCIQITYYATACVKETDDVSSVSGFACRNSLLQLWAQIKPNIPLEQCGGSFQSGKVWHSKALCLKATVRAFQSDRTSISKFLE